MNDPSRFSVSFPCAVVATSLAVRGSPSTSVSLASRPIVALTESVVSSEVVYESFVPTGGSSTGLTVNKKLETAVAPSRR